MKQPILNTQIRLEAPVYAEDGAGGTSESWDELGTLWGAIGNARARETLENGVSVSKATFAVTVRSAPQGAPSRPTERQRFKLGDRILRIIAVTEADGFGKYLTCLVSEEVSV